MGGCYTNNGAKVLEVDGKKIYPEDFLVPDELVIRTLISNKYKKIKDLGKGYISNVYSANDKNGKKFAIKEINRKDIKFGQMIIDEIKIGKKLNHPHLVKIIEVYETLEKISLVMDIKENGDLFEYIKNSPNNKLEPKVAIDLMIQIFDSLNYLHNVLHVCHRDMKPNNILITLDNNNKPFVNIIDFGFAVNINPDKKMKKVLGTWKYTAPEILLHQSYDEKVDIWSCGIILFNMMTGKDPFNKKDPIKQQVKYKIFNFKRIENEKIRDLITHLLDRNVETRFSSAQALDFCKKIEKEIV